MAFYRDALKELQPASFNTFVYLVRFLHMVSTKSAVNKMNTTNLSIVFGPTLLRPETETIETTLNSPIVNGIVQRIIEVCDAAATHHPAHLLTMHRTTRRSFAEEEVF